MGREKVNKPRKPWGHGGVKPEALEALELFPMDVSEALENTQATSRAMLVTGLDPAVMALRRVYKISGRQDYYGAAFDKGLTVEQAERLEGLILWLNKLGEAVSRLEAEGCSDES